MKLATTSADFRKYLSDNSENELVRQFKDTKFKHINLSQTTAPELFSDNDDDWKKFADACGEAAAYAGVTYPLSHAPCLNLLKQRDPEEKYKTGIRAIRRSIEVCHRLGIPRTVIHFCPEPSFPPDMQYRQNEIFYHEFLDLAEKYDIMILTENWDNDDTHFSLGEQMREFIDRIDHPLFSGCWDTAHGHISPKAREVGPYRNLIALGDKLKGMHVADAFAGSMHLHTWPFAGTINFDQVMQGLLDVNYDGVFTFEATYTLLHHSHFYSRKPWEYDGKPVTTLLDPSLALMKKAVDFLYDIGEHILTSYNCFEA